MHTRTSKLELGGCLGCVTLGATNDALVHAAVLSSDAVDPQLLSLASGAR